jgi:L-iditol 2-dehydrogenase
LKAAVLDALGTLVVKEVPDPVLEDNGVLVRVMACAVCGSDLRIAEYGNSRVSLPQILGHEIAGRVEAVGKGVEKFRVGDNVALGADVPCGACPFCVRGLGNNCGANYALGYQFPGGFAEYVALNRLTVDYGPVQKIPPGADFGEYALAEPLGCVLNGVELAGIRLGDTVVIIGCGPIGCMMIPVARKMGASLIIGVERAPERREAALRLGADAVIDHGACDMVEEVKRLTGGPGADVVFTATPAPQMQARAVEMARNRGRVSFFGGLPRGQSLVTLDTNLIHYKELLVMGAHGATPRHHLQAVELIRSGTIDMKPFISHEYPLDQAVPAFEKARSRACMRVVVKPWGPA